MESKNVILQDIKRLKEIKEENHLTNQQIADKLAAKGKFVSETTIKRVFSSGSESMNFRYSDSIAPLAEVLFDEYGETGGNDDPHELRKRIRQLDKEISGLMIKIEGMEDAKKMYDERKKILDSFIVQLQDEIELLKSQIDKKDKMFARMMNALVLKDKKDDE